MFSFQEKIQFFKFLIKMSRKISFVTALSLFLCYAFICILEYDASLFLHLLPPQLQNLSKHFFVSRKWDKIVINIELVSSENNLSSCYILISTISCLFMVKYLLRLVYQRCWFIIKVSIFNVSCSSSWKLRIKMSNLEILICHSFIPKLVLTI